MNIALLHCMHSGSADCRRGRGASDGCWLDVAEVGKMKPWYLKSWCLKYIRILQESQKAMCWMLYVGSHHEKKLVFTLKYGGQIMKKINKITRLFSDMYRSCVAGIILSAILITPAFAVHEDFELEGNVANDGATVLGDYDWGDLFDVSGGVATPKASPPANFFTPTFIRDFKLNPNGSFNTSDDSTFTTGSKDTLNIGEYPDGSGGTVGAGWQCNSDQNVLSQSDLINVYAVAFEDRISHDIILYFGAERNANTGTKNIGVWFLGDSTVGCDTSMGTANFTGNHVNGDLFIVSEFSNGGRVKWNQCLQMGGRSRWCLESVCCTHQALIAKIYL